jgi:ASC-1-like (ASCH) protein
LWIGPLLWAVLFIRAINIFFKISRGPLKRNGIVAKLPEADFFLSIISTPKQPYLELIVGKKKRAEGRIYHEKIRAFQGDKRLCLYNQRNYVLCRIVALHPYPSFEEMLLGEGIRSMLPFANSMEEALKIYNSFPGAHRVTEYGAVAILLDPIGSNIP